MLYVSSLGPWKPDYFYAIGGMVLNFVGSVWFDFLLFVFHAGHEFRCL